MPEITLRTSGSGAGSRIELGRGFSGAAVAERGSTRADLFNGSTGGPLDAPIGPDTRIPFSSLSKQVVAVCALALQERGRLDLHAPLPRLIPACPPQWSSITLHHLLAQTSGLGHWKDIPGFDISHPGSRDDLLGILSERPLLAAPGTQWRYSGPGYALASHVIECAGDAPYAELAAGLVLRPAGMSTATSGVVPQGPGVARGLRAGSPVDEVPGLAGLPGTGDQWGTLADLVAFIRALHSGALLRPESTVALATPHVAVSETAADGWLTTTGYSYGVRLGRAGSEPALFHAGDNPGYRSWLGWLPASRTVVAILSNDDADAVEPIAHRLADAVLNPSGSP